MPNPKRDKVGSHNTKYYNLHNYFSTPLFCLLHGVSDLVPYAERIMYWGESLISASSTLHSPYLAVAQAQVGTDFL